MCSKVRKNSLAKKCPRYVYAMRQGCTEDRYRKNETPLPVRCKNFACLWPTVDLCSSKMMIAEVLHQHVLYCDFHFQITAGAF